MAKAILALDTTKDSTNIEHWEVILPDDPPDNGDMVNDLKATYLGNFNVRTIENEQIVLELGRGRSKNIIYDKYLQVVPDESVAGRASIECGTRIIQFAYKNSRSNLVLWGICLPYPNIKNIDKQKYISGANIKKDIEPTVGVGVLSQEEKDDNVKRKDVRDDVSQCDDDISRKPCHDYRNIKLFLIIDETNIEPLKGLVPGFLAE